MAYVHSVAHSIPPLSIPQTQVQSFAKELFKNSKVDIDRLIPVFQNANIDSRPVCKPIEWYGESRSFREKNEEFLFHSLELAKNAALEAISKAGITSFDIGALVVVTSSGFVTPTLDARLMDILNIPASSIRLPIIGLGCAGGATGIARARELATVYPDKYILLIAVETCTLTFRPGDKRKENLIALSLFSDGAAAVVISGKQKDKSIKLILNSPYKWKDSLNVMGWDIEEDGLQVVFDKSIPDLIKKNYKEVYQLFLDKIPNGVTIDHHLYHPGGKKVLDAISESLNISLEKLHFSSEVLKKYGNLSSPTVIFVLEEFLSNCKFSPHEYGTLSALGPGFSSEILLFETT